MNRSLKDNIFRINAPQLQGKLNTLSDGNNETIETIVNNDYGVTYHNAKKICSDLKKYKSENNNVEFEKLGGHDMLNYLTKVLDSNRTVVDTSKFVRDKYQDHTKSDDPYQRVMGFTKKSDSVKPFHVDKNKSNSGNLAEGKEKIKIDLFEYVVNKKEII